MKETAIYIGDLRRHIGSHRNVHIEVPGESYSTGLVQIVGEITCDLILESVNLGIVVHGTLSTRYSAQCSYGLVEFIEPLHVVVNELFEEVKHGESPNSDSDTYQYAGEDIDIEQMLCDSIVPALPLAPVCGHGPENCTVCSSQIKPYIMRDINELTEHVIGDINDTLNDQNESPKDSRWSILDDFDPKG